MEPGPLRDIFDWGVGSYLCVLRGMQSLHRLVRRRGRFREVELLNGFFGGSVRGFDGGIWYFARLGKLFLSRSLAAKLIVDKLNDRFETEWELRRLRGGLLFPLFLRVADDRRLLKCSREETGERLFGKGRRGQRFWFLSFWFLSF